MPRWWEGALQLRRLTSLLQLWHPSAGYVAHLYRSVLLLWSGVGSVECPPLHPVLMRGALEIPLRSFHHLHHGVWHHGGSALLLS